ncbi:MAG: HAMP domain-containing protein, partial [Planctomycetota bacterium]
MTPPTDTAAAAAPDTNAGLDLQQLLRVLTAVKKGDFQQRMPEGLDGIAGKIADTLNDIVELNQTVAGELDRVSTAVGRDGKLRDRAAVANANGGWAGYIGSVNGLIGDLVLPTNEIARVVGAVARGDLTQRMVTEIEGREIKGEFLQTARVVNGMVDQLSVFSSEVTRVAREVGTDGKLGGQAEVLGVAGTWKDLTDSVNSMASNLTVQLRDVSKVATAIARGDLT